VTVTVTAGRTEVHVKVPARDMEVMPAAERAE